MRWPAAAATRSRACAVSDSCSTRMMSTSRTDSVIATVHASPHDASSSTKKALPSERA